MADTVTPKRRATGLVESLLLDLLIHSPRPLSAVELTERLQGGGISVYPSQVFRSLGRLCSRGLAHRVELAGGYVIGRSRCVGAVCRKCGAFRTVSADSTFAQLDGLARRHGFSVSRYVVELSGICEHCVA